MLLLKSKPVNIYAVIALLALPFIIAIVYTDGLKNPLPTFHGGDEMAYHYPLILEFANQFPFFDVSDYNSATTPLFHIVFALIGKVIGFEPFKLRFVNVLFSYSAMVLMYFILVNRFRMLPAPALLLTLIFELSPYFFGVSFILLTDNLTVLFMMAFFYCYFKYDESKKLSMFLISLFFLTLTVLTRQTFMYLSLSVFVSTLIIQSPFARKAKLLFFVFLFATPLLLFFFVWNGPVPPSLKEEHIGASVVNIRAISFGLSVVGFYSIFLVPESFFLAVVGRKILFFTLLLFSFVFMFLVPMGHATGDDGFIWRASRYLPNIFGSSPIFFVLITLGVIALVALWKKINLDFTFVVLLTSILPNTLNKLVFQKYYDVSIILMLIFIFAKFQIGEKSMCYKLFSLLILFIIYTVAYHFLKSHLT